MRRLWDNNVQTPKGLKRYFPRLHALSPEGEIHLFAENNAVIEKMGTSEVLNGRELTSAWTGNGCLLTFKLPDLPLPLLGHGKKAVCKAVFLVIPFLSVCLRNDRPYREPLRGNYAAFG